MTRFGKSLLFAASLHAVLCLGFVIKAPLRTASPPATLASVELQIEPFASPSQSNAEMPEHGNVTTRSTETSAGATPKSVPRASSVASRAIESDSAVPSEPQLGQLVASEAPADPANQKQQNPTAAGTIDLGLDGHMFMPTQAETQAAVPRAKALAKKLERNLNSALANDDIDRGLARGGVLTGPLNLATRVAGPPSGVATIRVTVNASGEVGDLELLRGADEDWRDALKAFRMQAKQRRLRVPAGSNGLRITLNVSAKTQRASGSDVGSTAVGVKRPSLLPDGLTLRGGFDVTDASGKTERMVWSRVVAEEVL